MNKRYSITLLLVAFCFFAFSQHAILKGFTYDESTGESLPYCTIQLMGTNYGALSDATGAFLINKIPAGTYTDKVSRLGYV
ncbi:MAG: carboxypeptidase-like regulatory domain-containing protein, partial [Bacteroidales bacterium]|nr:carboxypeptidase-like regulatory domain-containing protein [Bacteroidales bacterium]